MNTVSIHRRQLLAALAGAALAPSATLSFAATGAPQAASQRFVMVILRGGLDGLSAVPRPGDADFAEARGALGDFSSPPLPLSDGFALHPQLTQLHAMVGQGEATVVHAVGLAYHDRSHFDAQQVLESGGTQPHALTTGWLGRALVANGRKGMALSTAVPLTLRGCDRVDTWAPSVLPEPTQELVARLSRMYGDDPMLSAALARAQDLRMNGALTPDAMNDRRANGFAALARRAGEFLARADGPQVAVLEINGWDTHANQGAANGALANNLKSLDAGLGALREALTVPAAPDNPWQRTVVVVATEFGREVAINGTLGTDHGSGGAAFVLGGAVKGGGVRTDWPGLAPNQRFEGRDLRTTTDLRSVLKGVLGDHLQVASAALDNEVFPGSKAVRPMSLLR